MAGGNGFQVQTYLTLLDSEYPVEAARKSVDPLVVADMTDDCADRGRKLFAMLNSWTQEMPLAVKIARGIRDQNGFEFEHRELAPGNRSKSLIWRRTLRSHKYHQLLNKRFWQRTSHLEPFWRFRTNQVGMTLTPTLRYLWLRERKIAKEKLCHSWS